MAITRNELGCPSNERGGNLWMSCGGICEEKTGNVRYIKYLPYIGYWPAQPNDPSGIRVASVIEFSVLCLSVCHIFSNSTAV